LFSFPPQLLSILFFQLETKASALRSQEVLPDKEQQFMCHFAQPEDSKKTPFISTSKDHTRKLSELCRQKILRFSGDLTNIPEKRGGDTYQATIKSQKNSTSQPCKPCCRFAGCG
jgi:hypothetical protein